MERFGLSFIMVVVMLTSGTVAVARPAELVIYPAGGVWLIERNAKAHGTQGYKVKLFETTILDVRRGFSARTETALDSFGENIELIPRRSQRLSEAVYFTCSIYRRGTYRDSMYCSFFFPHALGVPPLPDPSGFLRFDVLGDEAAEFLDIWNFQGGERDLYIETADRRLTIDCREPAGRADGATCTFAVRVN